MGDLNFFYGFVQEKRARNRLIMLLLFAILVVLGGAGSIVLHLERELSKGKVNIHKQKEIIRSTKAIEMESNSQEVSEEERRIKASLKEIESIREYVSGLNKITTHEIMKIFNALPKNMNISSFECNQGQLSMECESFDRKGVATTINNLKGVGLKEVYVPSIVTVDSEGVTTYRFFVSANLQEAKKSECD